VTDIYTAVILFVVFFALDTVYVWYLRAVDQGKVYKAGFYTVICHGIYFLGVYELVADWKSIIFMLIGAAAGAVFAVKNK